MADPMAPTVQVVGSGESVTLAVELTREQAEVAAQALGESPFEWMREAGETIAYALGRSRSGAFQRAALSPPRIAPPPSR